MKPRQPPRSASLAFLLAQVGAHAAMRFAQKLGPLGLSPPHVGILRALHDASGISQQQLATLLGLHASRLVALVDDLETRGMAERRESPDDRRSHALQVTELGKQTLADIMRLAAKHQDELCAGLDAKEKDQLSVLLERIARQQGLTPGVHPGYARMGKKE
ncbi:MAG TPA: MarR family transcriptional regulator [Polyangiales bacterium]|nr:MarR family transcriptional regulator [Polyangiales bacterium]